MRRKRQLEREGLAGALHVVESPRERFTRFQAHVVLKSSRNQGRGRRDQLCTGGRGSDEEPGESPLFCSFHHLFGKARTERTQLCHVAGRGSSFSLCCSHRLGGPLEKMCCGQIRKFGIKQP